MITLTLSQARQLHLAAQGLLQAPTGVATRLALRRCIARMQLLQIDTISVVARSPYLVLYSRLGAYPPVWLDEALAQGHLFETWAHEACFAPVADLGAHRSYNAHARVHWGLKHAQSLQTKSRAQLNQLLAHVAAKGPVKSSDFERTDGKSGGWWERKDEKVWLEALFASGELMVARREGFQRVYDVAQRVHPVLQTLVLPAAQAVHQQFMERSVWALGITQARWVNDYFRVKPRLKDADLYALVEQGVLQRVAVEGWSNLGYVHRDHAALLKKAQKGRLNATYTTVLSPFDPVVWDRERALAMFDFDYRIECYTPQAKRKYGYFVLPLLHRGQLIGRLDAKAHRASGEFEIKALYLQEGVRLDDAALTEVAQALSQCAHWHETPTVSLGLTNPASLRARLQRCWATAK